MQIKTQEISLSFLKQKKVRLFVKRIDQVHPFVSGNKWYKLKYNLIKADQKTLVRHTHAINRLAERGMYFFPYTEFLVANLIYSLLFLFFSK